MNPSKAIIELVQKAQLAIDNTLGDPQIQAKMESYGYTVEKILDGKTRVQSVQQLVQQQQASYGEKLGATDELTRARETADKEYSRFRKVATVAFRNDRAAKQSLGITGKYPVTFTLWLDRTKQFYANALASPATLAKLAEFGVTQAQLEAAQQLVLDVEAAHKVRMQKDGQAQHTTYERNQKYKDMQDWSRDFFAIADVALAESPQLKEKIGLVEP